MGKAPAMQLARNYTLRDPQQCLAGFQAAQTRLVRDLHIAIDYVAYHGAELGEWDSITRTLRIRHGAELEDQLWLMQQLWMLLTVGPHAAHAAIRQPVLTIVPAPREPD
jgi:hypothetical protein